MTSPDCRPTFFVTSALSCYEHLIVNALRRIGPPDKKFNVENVGDRCRVMLVRDDDMTAESMDVIVVSVRNFINGFISGCEYTHCHGISPRPRGE